MHLSGLHLILSYRCTQECDHCFVWSSADREATLPLDVALDAVNQARVLGTVREIWIEGGEPFLLYPVMREIIRHAAELDMRCGVVTNGYFATTVGDAEFWLRPLKAAALSMLSVSDDAFHHDSTASDTPASRTIEAARNLGLSVSSICIQPPASSSESHLKGTPLEGGTVRFRGRAVEKLLTADVPRKDWSSFTECPDEDFVDLGRLHLDPYGNLYPCQGVVVGNLKQKSLARIVSEYQPQDHPIIGPLHRGGPAELVRAFDLPLRGQYADACHLCYLARQSLRNRFPEFLSPPEVYGQ